MRHKLVHVLLIGLFAVPFALALGIATYYVFVSPITPQISVSTTQSNSVTPIPSTLVNTQISIPTVTVTPTLIDQCVECYDSIRELTTPLIIKNINGVKFVISSTYDNRLNNDISIDRGDNAVSYLTVFENQPETISFLDHLKDYLNYTVRDVWIDTNRYEAFLIENLNNAIALGAPGEIALYHLAFTNLTDKNKPPVVDWKLINSFSQGLYSGTTIDAYYPNEGILILNTFGGDSCAGWGLLRQVKIDGSVTEIAKTGTGCGDGIHYHTNIIRNKLILGDSREITISDNPSSALINIYSIDPITLDRTMIMTDLTNYPNIDFYNPEEAAYDYPTIKENEIALWDVSYSSNSNKYYILNIESKQIRETTKPPTKSR